MFTLVKRWKIQISHRTEACRSVKLYSTWCRYNLLILYLTHKAIKVSSYHAAPLSGCRAESVNQPLEIWKRRQTGLLDLIYGPNWSGGCSVTAQDTEEMETHWTSFKLFPFPFVKKYKGWQTDMLWFWSARDIFYESLLSRKCPAVLAPCQNHKRGHCQAELWCSRTQQGLFCLAFLFCFC